MTTFLSFFKLVIYQPLYNVLVWLIDVIPGGDVGLAIILLTLAVRFVLFPFSKQSIITQKKMRDHQDELKEIQEKYKKDKQKQAEKMFEFYREKKIKPFSSFLLVLFQIPVIISLYLIFINTNLPEIQYDLLYNFVQEPGTVSMYFLGLIDLSGKSAGLALLAGLSSFVHLRMSVPVPKMVDNPSFKDDFARSMSLQMRYVLPIGITFIAFTFSAVVALYLLISNLFTLGQEVFVKRRL